MDDRLLKIGFEKAGQWELEKDAIRANFTMHAEQHNVLYAFACDGEVLYVGQSKRTLRKRMGNYSGSTLRDSSTNGRNKSLIIELLKTGSSVDIYALPDSGLMHYGEFHMNLAAALEESIIRALKPRWNWRPGKHGKKVLVIERDDEVPGAGEAIGLEGEPVCIPLTLDSDDDRLLLTSVTEVDESAEPSVSPRGQFEFRLEPSYWSRGFFNGRNAASQLLGGHGEKIEIFFGAEQTPFYGSINRRNTGPGATPRVSSGAGLRSRFQAFREGQVMVVDVLSPLSIRIRPKSD